MATVAEVLDLLGDLELPGSDRDEEDGYGVSAYTQNPSKAPEKVQALGGAVTSNRLLGLGVGAAPSARGSAFMDSCDAGRMEEDS